MKMMKDSVGNGKVNKSLILILFAFLFIFLVSFGSASLYNNIDELTARPCALNSSSVVDVSALRNTFNISSSAVDCNILVDELPFSSFIMNNSFVDFGSGSDYGLIYYSSSLEGNADYFFVLGKNSTATAYLISILTNYSNYSSYFLKNIALFYGEGYIANFSSAGSNTCSSDVFIDEFTKINLSNSYSSCINSSLVVFPRCADENIKFSSNTCDYGCNNGACLRNESATTDNPPVTTTTTSSSGSGGSGGGGGGGSGSSVTTSSSDRGTSAEILLNESSNLSSDGLGISGSETRSASEGNVFTRFFSYIKELFSKIFS